MPFLQCDAKRCSACQEEKPLTEFYRTKQSKDGYRYQCKVCHTSNEANTNPDIKRGYARKSYLKRKAEQPESFMHRQAKHRAKWDYNNMEFTIEVEDIKIPDVCPFMQQPFIPLDRVMGHSLDRIDSSKGYTKDNIQVISRLANKMKNDATKEQLIAFAKGVLVVYPQAV